MDAQNIFPKLSLLSKKNLVRFLLALWLLLSAGYIAWDGWNKIKNNLMQQAYEQGISDTVNQLITQVEGSNCQQIQIYNKATNKNLAVINATCVTNTKIK